MSGFKGTPGPWLAREVNGAGWPGQKGYAIDFNEDQEQVVDFVYEEADARLIAAAPELLEALLVCAKSMESVLPDFNPYDQMAYDKARAAIAKALGTESDQ